MNEKGDWKIGRETGGEKIGKKKENRRKRTGERK